MRLLVVGASGFIGRHLLHGARAAGWTVFGTAHAQSSGVLPSPCPLPLGEGFGEDIAVHSGLQPRFDFARAAAQSDLLARFDLAQDRIWDADLPGFLEDGVPRVAVICAGVTGIDRCRLERDATRLVNVDGTIRLVQDLNARGVPCVYLSSDAVFDGRRGGYTETDTPAPLTEYGRQKLAAEAGVLAAVPTNIVSPHGVSDSPGDFSGVPAAAPKNLVLRLGKIVGDVPGEPHLFTEWLELQRAGRPIRCIRGQVFSPTWVEDVVAGVLAALRLGLTGRYHLAGFGIWSRVELARRFLAAVGGTADVVEEDLAAFGFAEARPLCSWLDGSRFAAATGLRFATMPQVLASFASQLVAEGSVR